MRLGAPAGLSQPIVPVAQTILSANFNVMSIDVDLNPGQRPKAGVQLRKQSMRDHGVLEDLRVLILGSIDNKIFPQSSDCMAT